jgi:quinol monooxygenase YgiN
MVLYVMKWNIHPDKMEEYMQWTESAIGRTMAVPGVVEFRAYRPASGWAQVVATYEFADLAAWAAFYAHPDVRDVTSELRTLTTSVTTEVWGPSPVVPEPIRPGG